MSDSMYGWRARIGFIGPSGASENTPYEFYLMAPEGVTMVVNTLGLTFTGVADPVKAFADLETPVKELTQRGVHAIVQVGVPYLVAAGPGFERELAERISRVTSVPATFDIVSCVDALHALEVSRIALVTPFPEGTNADVTRYLKAYDIDVVGLEATLPEPGKDLSIKPLSEVYQAAKRAFRSADGAEAILINGARMPSVAIIDDLERDLGVPVVSSMQAMTWASLRMVKVKADVVGYGRLFEIE